MSSFVDVIPIQPPFVEDCVSITFQNTGKQLAVARSDYNQMVGLFGANFLERLVTLSKAPDGIHIRVSVVCS